MVHIVQAGEVALPCLQGNQQQIGTVESSSSYMTKNLLKTALHIRGNTKSNTVTLLALLSEYLDLVYSVWGPSLSKNLFLLFGGMKTCSYVKTSQNSLL